MIRPPGYFECIRCEAFSKGIRVTTICPGPVLTTLIKNSFHSESFLDEVNQSTNLADGKLSVERCTQLMLVAIANKLQESWISLKPILWFCYCYQYLPDISKYIMVRYFPPDKLYKMRRGQSNQKPLMTEEMIRRRSRALSLINNNNLPLLKSTSSGDLPQLISDQSQAGFDQWNRECSMVLSGSDGRWIHLKSFRFILPMIETNRKLSSLSTLSLMATYLLTVWHWSMSKLWLWLNFVHQGQACDSLTEPVGILIDFVIFTFNSSFIVGYLMSSSLFSLGLLRTPVNAWCNLLFLSLSHQWPVEAIFSQTLNFFLLTVWHWTQTFLVTHLTEV